MTFKDILSLALNNLRRTKLRTFLTTLGVIIGIAALTSMVSFGTGLEKNVTDVFNTNDLFTSLTITSSNLQFRGPHEETEDTASAKKIPLNDSVIEVIKKYPEVDVIYPEIKIPARVKLGNDSTTITAQGMPARMGTFKPYDQLMGGKFFTGDSDNVVVVSTRMLRKLNMLIKDSLHNETNLDTSKVKNKKKRYVTLDSVIGRKITLSTASFNPMPMMGFAPPSGGSGMAEVKYEFVIGGVMKSDNFGRDVFGGDIFIPIKRAKAIPSVGFTNVLEFLSRAGGEKSKYSSVYVRVKDMLQTDSVKARIEKMKLSVFSFSDQLKEIKKGFIIIQSVLGVVGIISLFVAGLGIINTMLMSILERTREIGIMKAIGGSELQIRSVFFFEAATIGFFGGIGGLFIGWLITRVANLFVNVQMTGSGNDPINLFYFPTWLIIGALLFSILISLLAGLYPAIRASRIDPVEALRHN